MRLLMTTDTVGGVWTYTKDLTAELLQKGVAVALVTIGRVPSPLQREWLERTAAEWAGAFRWEMSEAPLEWMSNNERAYLDAEPLLLRVGREFGAQLLHSNQFCFGALPFPNMVVAHSDVLSWAASCRVQMESSAWLDAYFQLVSRGLKSADVVVAPTQWMLDALAVNFSLPGQARVIANGRNLKRPAACSERKLQAVTAGRLWDEAKNLKLLQEVRSPFPVLLAGEEEYESQTVATRPAATTMLGPLAENDLLALFRESAIYLCTSQYEPFGLAPLEAALCGCAVVANDIDSLREVWTDGALYFGDASSLSALLARLACDPHLLVAAQRRSRRRAERYTAARMTEQYLRLYGTIVRSAEAMDDGSLHCAAKPRDLRCASASRRNSIRDRTR
jgi:glycogen synthase